MIQHAQPKSIGRKIIKIILGVIAAFVIWVLFLVIYPYGYYHGQIIDKETRQPIEGAAVLAVYSVERHTLAGTVPIEVTAQETITDKDGNFYIPRKLIIAVDILVEHDDTAFVIFKPGYAVFPDGKAWISTPDRGGWIHEKEFTVVELPRLKTIEERKDNLMFSEYYDIEPRKKKHLLKLIREERRNVGLSY
jgi:hypothetical protein